MASQTMNSHHPQPNAPSRDDYQQVAELLAVLEVYLPNCDSPRAQALFLPLSLTVITHAVLAGAELNYERINEITANLRNRHEVDPNADLDALLSAANRILAILEACASCTCLLEQAQTFRDSLQAVRATKGN